MGGLGGMLGFGGGASGTGYDAPINKVADPTGNMNLENTYNLLNRVSEGGGPNPAQMQYQQNVQNLAKQQAGAISSVQGISPALAARMISQQGGGAMQNAAAAGATTAAQQQLGALGQMGSVAGTQGNIASSMQQNINNANAGLIQAGMQGQQGLMGGIMSGFGATSSMAGGASAAAARGGVVTKHGMVHKMAEGGDVSSGPVSQFAQFLSGGGGQSIPISVQASPVLPAVSGFGKGLGGYGAQKGASGGGSQSSQGEENQGQGPTNSNNSQMGAGVPYGETNFGSQLADTPYGGPDTQYTDSNFGSNLMNAPTMAKGGQVPALVSPGEQYLPPSAVKQVQKGKNPLGVGERIPGTPKVPGNSYANDTVPKKLEAGGIVIPNSIMQSKNPAEAAKRFVEACIAKGHAKGKASK